MTTFSSWIRKRQEVQLLGRLHYLLDKQRKEQREDGCESLMKALRQFVIGEGEIRVEDLQKLFHRPLSPSTLNDLVKEAQGKITIRFSDMAWPEKLFQNRESAADVKLDFGKQELSVHWYILRLFSGLFDALQESHCSENLADTLLQLAYTGHLTQALPPELLREKGIGHTIIQHHLKGDLFEKLFNDPDTSDFTIHIEDHQIGIHKDIMKASGYFMSSIATGPFKEAQESAGIMQEHSYGRSVIMRR